MKMQIQVPFLIKIKYIHPNEYESKNSAVTEIVTSDTPPTIVTPRNKCYSVYEVLYGNKLKGNLSFTESLLDKYLSQYNQILDIPKINNKVIKKKA